MELYEQLKEGIEALNFSDPTKAFLKSKRCHEHGLDLIKFQLVVNDVTIYFTSIVLSETMDEESAKRVASANILAYLIKTRLPIWIESNKVYIESRF